MRIRLFITLFGASMVAIILTAIVVVVVPDLLKLSSPMWCGGQPMQIKSINEPGSSQEVLHAFCGEVDEDNEISVTPPVITIFLILLLPFAVVFWLLIPPEVEIDASHDAPTLIRRPPSGKTTR